MARVEEQNHENQLTFMSPNEVNLKVDDFLYTVENGKNRGLTATDYIILTLSL